jgi:hypothetical protein
VEIVLKVKFFDHIFKKEKSVFKPKIKRIMKNTRKKYKKIYSITPEGYGQKRVTIEYYGKLIHAHWTDMEVTDKFKSDERGWKTAGNRLYDYVVYKNKKLV